MTLAMHQVLVVEDDAGIRDVLRAMLAAANYRVVEADTAARGEIEARAHKPDLLIVDLGLPDRDGIELIRSVRALVRPCPSSCCPRAPARRRRSPHSMLARMTT